MCIYFKLITPLLQIQYMKKRNSAITIFDCLTKTLSLEILLMIDLPGDYYINGRGILTALR